MFIEDVVGKEVFDVVVFVNKLRDSVVVDLYIFEIRDGYVFESKRFG